MTKEEYIDFANALKNNYTIDFDKLPEFCDMAISALSTEGDLISRQAVLDALKEHRALYCDNTPDTFSKLSYAEKSRVDELDTAIATIINLPSVENKGEFDGMNNGEVMNLVLRKTFPRTIFIRGIDEYNKTKSIVYSEEWENAPYQKGGE